MTKLLFIGDAKPGQANEDVKQAFSGKQFPLSVVVTNMMTITLSLPEARIRLAAQDSETVNFDSMDRLQRTASSLEQIARLNSAPRLVSIALPADTADAEPLPADEATAEPVAETEPEPEAEGEQGEAVSAAVVTVIQDDATAYIVELEGVQFSPNRGQVRADGTLTTGGLKAFEEAKAATEKQGAV